MRDGGNDFFSPIDPKILDRSGDQPQPAPPWVAFLSAWAGLLVLIAAIVFIFLPGTHRPRAELEHAAPYSAADRFLPFMIYGCAIASFIAIVVLWQMRKLPRPLPEPMVMQKIQACVGLFLALLGAAVVYIDVAVRGPK